MSLDERSSSVGREPGADLVRTALRDAREIAQCSGTAVDPSGGRWVMTPSSASIPGYEMIREVHRGGQGVVYLALHKATSRKVAIKVLREGALAGPREKARFEREVQILGRLKHPNIVGVHDSGEVGEWSYHVMDYIPGQPLDVYVASAGLSINQVLALFQTIGEAVAAAHLRGVIHRDLKPANIRIDPEGQPHILDFGLARFGADQSDGGAAAMTITGQFVGSLPWSSPEQAEGVADRIDIRTDVYSLGVVLFQMLTGRFPYDVAGTMRDVLENVLHATPQSPRSLNPRIDDEVETIVLKCVAKERERRYQSAGEVARDIGHYLAGKPIEAKRDSGWYVLKKTLQRYRGRAAVAAAFLLLLILFLAVSWGLTLEARSLREAAQEDARRSNAVAKVFEGMLQQVDWSGTNTYDLVLLDDAERTVSEGFDGSPADEDRLRFALGNAYMNAMIGIDAVEALRAARRQAERIVELRTARYGPEHRATLQAKDFLISILLQMRDDNAAEGIARDNFQQIARRFEPDDPMVLDATFLLGFALSCREKYEDAELHMRRALELSQGLHGERGWPTWNIMGHFVDVLLKNGKATEAESLVRTWMQRAERFPPENRVNALSFACMKLSQIAAHVGDEEGRKEFEAQEQEYLDEMYALARER